jgi:hypothetical protein
VKIVYLTIGLLLILIIIGVYYYYHINHDLVEAYEAEWAGEMCVEYMKTHNDGWPSSWDELTSTFSAISVNHGHPFSFNDIRNAIIIDWSFKPMEYKLDAGPPHAFSERDGHSNYWSGHRPDEIVYRYLQERRDEKASGSQIK